MILGCSNGTSLYERVKKLVDSGCNFKVIDSLLTDSGAIAKRYNDLNTMGEAIYQLNESEIKVIYAWNGEYRAKYTPGKVLKVEGLT